MTESIKKDVIAAAKVIYDQLSTHERIEFIAAIRGQYKLTITGRAQGIGNIPQSERTYKTWNQDNSLHNVGIKRDD